MMRPLSGLLLSAMLCLAAGWAHASAKVVIVSSDNSDAYAQAAQTLTSVLVSKGIAATDIRLVAVSDWQPDSELGMLASCHVALGTSAAAALAASQVSTPVLSALLPRASFERVLRSGARKTSALFTAIYLDQPMQRQLAVIRAAMPLAKRLGVLWGADSVSKAPVLRALAKTNGFTLNEAGAQKNFDLFRDLQSALIDSDVFLALADPQVFNSSTIQNILLTTFRARVPVVAFSPAYVRAGALLALYTTPEQTGRQAAELVLAALRGKPLPPSPVESVDFEVSVNANVAKALGLSLDSAAIRESLVKLEKSP
jgi:ABC-type uncharacterized transport system substrate-binding protein